MKRTYRPINPLRTKKSNHWLFPTFFLVAAVLMLASVGSKACDEVYVGAWSYHINDDRDLNETHYLFACEKDGYIAGGMKNSHGDPAALLGKGFDLFESGDLKAIVYIGATYGYFGCDNKDKGGDRSICPMVIPELSYTKYRVKPSVVIMGNAVAVTFKVGF